MLALVTAQGARLDAGSVGLAISRSWSDAGRRVLFVDGDTERGMECGVEGGTVVTLEAGAARARDGGDNSGGEVDFSDAVVAGVGDVEVVIVVDGESVGGVQGGY